MSRTNSPSKFSPTARLVALVTAKPAWVILFYAAALSLCIYGAITRLGVDTDSSSMLSSELDFQQKTKALNAAFPGIKNSIIVVVRSTTSDAADAVTGSLVASLSKSDSVSGVFAPSVDPFMRKNGLLYQSVDDLEEHLDRLNKSASLLANLREKRTLENFFHTLFTADEMADKAEFDKAFLRDFYKDVTETIKVRLDGGRAPLSWVQDDDDEVLPIQRLLYATPVLDFTAIQPAKASQEAVRRAIEAVPDNIKSLATIAVTGDPVLRFEELRSVSTGIGWSLGLSFLLVAVLLVVAYRSFINMIVTLLALVVALVLTTGFAAFVFGDLNLVSVAFIVLLVGLGLDFSIHVVAHLQDHDGEGAVSAFLETAKGIGSALALSAATTALAFAAFVPTDFVGIAQLGVLGAVGVLIAYIISITFVPAVLCILRSSELKARSTKLKSGDLVSTAFVTLQKPLAALLVILTIAASFVVPHVRFDADPVALRDPESPSMRALNLLKERLDTAPYRLSVLRTDEEAAKKAADDLKKLSTVHEARVLTDFVPEAQDEKFELIDLAFTALDTIVSGEGIENSDLPNGKTSLVALRDKLVTQTDQPEPKAFSEILTRLDSANDETKKAVEADLFLFFQALIDTVKLQSEGEGVSLETLPDFFKNRFQDEKGVWRVDVVPNVDVQDPAKLTAFVNEVQAYDAGLAGAPLQIAKAGETVSKAMLTAVQIAAAAVLLLSFVVLRKVSLVVAIAVPLTMAGILTAGASVFFDVPFNYANVIVLPLLIGLGVDSGIHVALRRAQVSDTKALYSTSTPRAVLFSGLTTIAAFATLSVSDHQGTASMGIMLALAITATLLTTIVITPLLVDFFEKMRRNAH